MLSEERRKKEWANAAMVEKSRQVDEPLRQDGLLPNIWGLLAIVLGILLALAVLVALGFLVRW